jgi:glycosyltransferase involved in cell wall biosynthesis
MTILHVLPDHDLGGGAVNTARLIRALEARGMDEPQLALLPANASPGMREVFADLPHVIERYAGRGAVHRMAQAILRRAARGDVVHAQGTRAALGAMLARPAKPGLRTVYTVRGFHGLAQPGLLGARARLERLLARGIDATVFVSNADAALARESGLRYPRLAEVIENGIETPPVPADAPRDIDLLFVGRLVRQKWPEAFLEAAARLPGAPRIVMIGAGELAGEVDAMARRLGLARLERHDGLPPAETLACMARARLLVTTSRWEGLPTVAIEAAQSGALVAGHRIAPLAEVLGEIGDETLTPPEPEALAARLAELLDDEPRRRRLAERLQARARGRFSPGRMAGRYAEVYRRVREAG